MSWPTTVAWLLALLLAAWPESAQADTRAVLSGLIGRSKAEVIGRISGRSGQDTRAGGTSGGPVPHSYSFRCRTEVVIRDGQVAAFNRSGNDRHWLCRSAVRPSVVP